METIYWVGNRFKCSGEVDALHWAQLCLKKDVIARALKSLDFQLDSYKVDFRCITVKHGTQWFDIADEGTGFNLCLHLLGFMFVGGVAVKESSLYGCLHPFVLQVLKRSSRPPAIIPCSYLSDTKFLRCAVHPSRVDCEGCSDYVATDKVQPGILWV